MKTCIVTCEVGIRTITSLFSARYSITGNMVIKKSGWIPPRIFDYAIRNLQIAASKKPRFLLETSNQWIRKHSLDCWSSVGG
jgi:hypothetical protein